MMVSATNFFSNLSSQQINPQLYKSREQRGQILSVIQSQPNEEGSECGEYFLKETREPKDLPFIKTPSKANIHKNNSKVRASLEKN